MLLEFLRLRSLFEVVLTAVVLSSPLLFYFDSFNFKIFGDFTIRFSQLYVLVFILVCFTHRFGGKWIIFLRRDIVLQLYVLFLLLQIVFSSLVLSDFLPVLVFAELLPQFGILMTLIIVLNFDCFFKIFKFTTWVWFSLILIAVFCEYRFGVNVYHDVCFYLSDHCNIENLHFVNDNYDRQKIGTRISGPLGVPALSGLIFGFFALLALATKWNSKRFRIFRSAVFSISSLMVFVLLASRAALIAFIVSVSRFNSFRVKDLVKYVLLIFNSLILCFLLDSVFDFTPIIQYFSDNRFGSVVEMLGAERLGMLDAFFSKTFEWFPLGLGGDIHSVHSTFFDYDDAPAIITYFVVNSFLGGLYLSILSLVFVKIYNFRSGLLSRNSYMVIDINIRIITFVVICGFFTTYDFLWLIIFVYLIFRYAYMSANYNSPITSYASF